MRKTAVAFGVIAAALAGAPLRAQSTNDALQRCYSYTDPGSGNPDRAAAGCTAVIESTQFTDAQRTQALATRGTIFRKTGHFDLAIVDFTEVLRRRHDADDEIYVERGMALK